MNFKFSSNPNHSMILSFFRDQTETGQGWGQVCISKNREEEVEKRFVVLCQHGTDISLDTSVPAGLPSNLIL